jgi:HAD superfamily hydrolase (TIGR01509 family)
VPVCFFFFCQVDANLAAAGFAAGDFDAVVAADDFEAIKPAPDIFLAAARMMGVAPADCVVVEDAPAGIQAAKAAGAHPTQRC